MIFPFLAKKLMSQNFNWFIGRHFETECPIFWVLLRPFFFFLFYQWLKFQYKIPSEKNVSDQYGAYPLITNERTEDLDHLSVNFVVYVSFQYNFINISVTIGKSLAMFVIFCQTSNGADHLDFCVTLTISHSV